MTDFWPSGRCFELPSRFKTPTGTITVGGGGKPPDNCCKGGIVEQYSIGLFGLGCFPYKPFVRYSQLWLLKLYFLPQTIKNGLRNTGTRAFDSLSNLLEIFGPLPGSKKKYWKIIFHLFFIHTILWVLNIETSKYHSQKPCTRLSCQFSLTFSKVNILKDPQLETLWENIATNDSETLDIRGVDFFEDYDF